MSISSEVKFYGGMLTRSLGSLYHAIPRDRKSLKAALDQKVDLAKKAGMKKISEDGWITARHLLQAGIDLITLIAPKVHPTKPGAFAFCIHPRDIEDVYRQYPLFRYLPETLTMEIARYLPPIWVSHIEGVKLMGSGELLPGHLLSIVQTPQHMMDNPKFAVIQAVLLAKFARKRGIGIIGLGALLPSLTKYGTIIKKHAPKIGVTTGHAYTSLVIAKTALKVKKIVSPDKDEYIAVVGAAGSTGTASAWVLAKNGVKKLLLIEQAKKKGKLDELAGELKKAFPDVEIELSTNLIDIKKARIIITVTNAAKAIINEEMLKPGMIFVDDAQPPNISQEIAEKHADIKVLKVLAHVPNLEPNFDFGLGTPSDITFTCLAETAVLASRGWQSDFTVGYVKMSDVATIEAYAPESNVSLTKEFYTFKGKVITVDDIRRVGALWQD